MFVLVVGGGVYTVSGPGSSVRTGIGLAEQVDLFNGHSVGRRLVQLSSRFIQATYSAEHLYYRYLYYYSLLL